MYLDTVGSEISKPSLMSSPWIRGAPQRLSVAISRISLRTSRSILGRPGLRFLREIRVHYARHVAKARPCSSKNKALGSLRNIS